MKKLKCILIIVFLFASSVMAESSKHNFIPEEGYVPDETTAIKIAEAVWLPIYGVDIYKKKPFEAELKGGVWLVTGSMPRQMLGGVPEIEISKKTGQVIRVSHGQ